MNIFEIFQAGRATKVGLTTETIVSTSSKMDSTKLKTFFGSSEVTLVKDIVADCRSNYANTVNNQLEREGKEANFKARKSPYISYGNKNSAILFLRSNPLKWYFKYMNPQTLSEKYFIDGREATDIEVRLIKDCFRKRTSTSRQGTDKHIVFRAVKFSSIKDIRFMNDVNGEFTLASLEVPAGIQAKAYEIKANETQTA